MCCATAYGKGIRILRQEKWEALCSFIISQNNHIPRIKKIVEALCELFGEQVEFDGKIYYSFPPPEKLCTLDESDLAPLKCGYRASYILSAAKAVTDGSIDLGALSQSSLDIARKELLKIHGVGNKVADCVLLFGLGLLDSFPVDVWMRRALSEHFSPDLDPSVFSPYAGIAQQYIFHYKRSL
jgi:N-glycosylase/DNA lyase